MVAVSHIQHDTRHSPLAEILIEKGRIDPTQVERVLRLQEGSGERLGALLVKLGLVSDSDIAEALSQQLGHPIVDALDYPQDPALEGLISPKFLKESMALPIGQDENQVLVAMVDPDG